MNTDFVTKDIRAIYKGYRGIEGAGKVSSATEAFAMGLGLPIRV